MKKIIFFSFLMFSICACNRSAINTLKDEVLFLQHDLNVLKSQIGENELTLLKLNAQKDSIGKCLDEIKVVIATKKNTVDSLYNKAYPSISSSSYATGRSKRGPNQGIMNDSRFKIKEAIVF